MDEETYISLCERHLPSLFRLAYSLTKNRHDAEDAVQQALLKAWTCRSRARAGAERAWIIRILVNECYDLLRRRRRTVPMAEFPEAVAPPSGLSMDTGLRDAIDALPDGLRLPFLMKYMEGMTEKEVASALRLPLSAVKHRLYRARRALRQAWNEEVE